MRDVCLFAHFDKDNAVAEYVLRYVRKIKELQFSIIFVSTAELSPVEIERLRVECTDVIVRENAGLDFGSWSAGFARYKADIGGRLLLANDSVYGPVGSLTSAFNRLTATSADFYGFVESIEHAPHLQSWFLLLEPNVVQSVEFGEILGQQFSGMTKNEIITYGELGMSYRLVKAGFRYNALYRSSSSGLAARFFPTNPTQILWRELLLCEKIPFIKVELLRDNPLNVEDKNVVLSVVNSIDPSSYDPIKDHLASYASSSDQSSSSRLSWALQSKYEMMRRGYHLWRRHRWTAELANLITLLALEVLMRVRHTLGGARKPHH